MGVLKMGTVALDGTKIHANASRHSALSHEHAGKIEAQLKAEVADLMAKAEAADAADLPDGMSIPDELARREERLRKIAEARAKIEARARERHARAMAEHEAKNGGARGQDGGDGQETGRRSRWAASRTHPPLAERFEPVPAAPDNPTPVEAMAHRLKTPRGRALHALRKQTPEPVFGIIKSVLGFRQFSLRGLEKVRGEWSLMAWNMKRLFAVAPAY
jgi:Transposase DDE domain